jgi:diguanylate cyclase (GGDEF)-like protein/PAS domain S-box-containing protein
LNTDIGPTTLLLVENDAEVTSRIQQALFGTKITQFNIECVTRLDTALQRLHRQGTDVVLLDLMLPGCNGLDAIHQVRQAAPHAVILVLSEEDDEVATRLAIQQGANDYIVKDHIDHHWLPRALRYNIEQRSVQNSLRNSEARFRAISDASPLGIMVSDLQGKCVYTNAAYHTITGLTFEESLGENWSLAVHPEDRQRVQREWREAVRHRTVFHSEVRFMQRDNLMLWARLNAAAMRDDTNWYGHVQTVENITQAKATELALRENENVMHTERERAEVTLNSIGDAVLSTDVLGNVTYLNRVAEKMTGWTAVEAQGRSLPEILHIIEGSTRTPAENPALSAISRNTVVKLSINCVLIRRDGLEVLIEDSTAPIHDYSGQVSGAVIVFRDVSEARLLAIKLAHMAQHDFLTGLANRLLLTEHLDQALKLAKRQRKQVAVLFMDVDFFKHINDSLGHSIGDQVLQLLATRLRHSVRATDTVCRQGGDEFVVLLADIEKHQDASRYANKLLASLETPQFIEGHELHITLSIGISMYPDDGDVMDALLQNADTAMFHAKAAGRNNYQFFKADMNARATRLLQVENGLRRALKQKEFVLHYQPQINLISGEMTGAEALIRWNDPELGLLYPEQFIAIAEASGLIVPVGNWVLREACTQMKAWQNAGLRTVPLAVNVSAVELRHPKFLEGISRILLETGLAPEHLEMELTENILIHDSEASIKVLRALSDLGILLALDDFGTGYSSLSYLQRFPISTLKIDQSFVRDITTDPDDASIVSAVIGLAKNLHQHVIAEGVENQEQLAFLRARKCETGQGYQFSPPLPATAFEQLLKPATVAGE